MPDNFSLFKEKFSKSFLRGIEIFNSSEEPAVIDIMRSMKRLGFSQDEVFDTFTGAGVPSSDVQLLLDRVEIDFEDAELEDQKSRLSKEVDEIFSRELEKVKIELESKLRKINHHVKSMNNDLDSLEERVSELQGICHSSKAEGE